MMVPHVLVTEVRDLTFIHKIIFEHYPNNIRIQSADGWVNV